MKLSDGKLDVQISLSQAPSHFDVIGDATTSCTLNTEVTGPSSSDGGSPTNLAPSFPSVKWTEDEIKWFLPDHITGEC